MGSKKFLTTAELEAILEDDEFFADLEKEDISDVNVAIIPPTSDQLTDLEDIEDNVLDEDDLKNDGDVAGTLELFAPQIEDTYDDHQETVAKRRKKKTTKSSLLNKKKSEEIKWKSISPTYSNTNTASKDKFENVRKILEGYSAVEIFECIFTDIFQLIIEESEIYAKQKNTINFSLSLEELKRFIGILLLSGYHKLPQEDMYWEQAPDTGVSIVFNSMSRNRFREIKRYLHLNDNSKLDKNDKFYKLRKFFDILQINFTKFGIFYSKLSIDEMMVRYYGRHPTKMYMHGKPIKFGYKIWCLCSSNGYLYSFEPYGGKSNNENEGPLGSRVVKNLIKVIPSDTMEDHEVFFDNFFTGHELLIDLQSMKLKATGTVRENRTKQCPLMTCKEMEKTQNRGYFETQFDKTGEVLMVRWKDNKTVTMASNYSDVLPVGNVKRFSRKDKKHISLPIPRVFNEYNKYMGGVDLLDKQISLYRTRIRSKKWWWPLFTQFLDISVINTWRLYQICHPSEEISLLDVRRKIVVAYLWSTKASRKRPGPQKAKVVGGRVSSEIRFDKTDHLIKPINTQRRCAACGKKTTRICKRCDVPLHDKCFENFHTP